ncbi:DUF1772 domain-containing protein [Nitratireductor sp. ZSWI3]|uniref:DUF1772 domain-containing protein n=1 Tax=Nitratireductor sp. ZSWI3 TaxID=2966359 RepID=UPI00215053DC|nr:DUF1772 domain-containing protein [Nitratireductor sp. ZSWI3]MCR4265803.1 DUF1772 domain-containing protein [Nitratireductor sp. ZSWI3]
MVKAFHIFALLLVAVAMALSLAHALELPGKMRLSKETYLSVQEIYYPGFTYGGFSEIGGILALAVLLFLLPFVGARFWWVAVSLALLSMSHLTYWLFTHPVNGFWLKDMNLSGLGGVFFSTFGAADAADWTRLRDIWEYSHVARACFAMLSFIAAATALSF